MKKIVYTAYINFYQLFLLNILSNLCFVFSAVKWNLCACYLSKPIVKIEFTTLGKVNGGKASKNHFLNRFNFSVLTEVIQWVVILISPLGQQRFLTVAPIRLIRLIESYTNLKLPWCRVDGEHLSVFRYFLFQVFIIIIIIIIIITIITMMMMRRRRIMMMMIIIILH